MPHADEPMTDLIPAAPGGADHEPTSRRRVPGSRAGAILLAGAVVAGAAGAGCSNTTIIQAPGTSVPPATGATGTTGTSGPAKASTTASAPTTATTAATTTVVPASTDEMASAIVASGQSIESGLTELADVYAQSTATTVAGSSGTVSSTTVNELSVTVDQLNVLIADLDTYITKFEGKFPIPALTQVDSSLATLQQSLSGLQGTLDKGKNGGSLPTAELQSAMAGVQGAATSFQTSLSSLPKGGGGGVGGGGRR